MPYKVEKEQKTPATQVGHPRKGEVFPRRVRGVRERYEVDTRKTIENAIRNLEELAEEAHKRATSKYLPTEVRQKWTRIEAYLYQIINSLTKTHDSQMVMEKLEELTRIVDKLMEEDQGPREED
jgi:DNA-binding ferritin-like protein (Dps family)